MCLLGCALQSHDLFLERQDLSKKEFLKKKKQYEIYNKISVRLGEQRRDHEWRTAGVEMEGPFNFRMPLDHVTDRFTFGPA